MANFWDLPRPVRDMIYRLHLVEEEPITTEKHRNFAEDTTEPDMYQVGRRPRICAVSPKAESEAAPIYYGENYFVFGWNKTGSHSSVFSFTGCTSPRHLRMIRKVTFQWPLPYSYHSRAYGMAGESFTEIARFKGLQELYIRVDEEAMVRKMLVSRRSVQLSPPRPLTHQDGIAILRHPGMSGLLKISGVPKVEFIKRFSYSGAEQGGPIPGGYLQTEILSKMVAPRKKTTPCRRKDCFDFLALPPELRNRIYALLLKFDGPIHPSPKSPSSVPKKIISLPVDSGHGSALNILGVNHQIHDEAFGIFYDANELEFYYPIQLHAFVLALSPARLRQIRKVTIHYHNVNSGGINLAELSLPMLKQLSGLRKLRILFLLGRLKDRLWIRSWYTSSRYGLRNANPLKLPGMKSLFALRGVTDIEVRDTDLDTDLEGIKKDQRYPDGFAKGSLEHAKLDLGRVLEHVNAALQAAQVGNVTAKMLQDDTWHLRDEFPIIESKLEDVEVEEEDPAQERAGTEVEFDDREAVDGGAGEDGSEADEKGVWEGGLQGEETDDAIQTDGVDQDDDDEVGEIVVSAKLPPDPAPTDDGAEDEIVVTGRRTRSKMARAKQAASGITGNQARPSSAQIQGIGYMPTDIEGANGDEDSADEIVVSSKRAVPVESEEDGKDDLDIDDSYWAREHSVEL